MSKYFSGEEQSQSSTINEKSLAEKTIFQKFKLYKSIIRDKIIIYRIERWLIVVNLALIFMIRVVKSQGFYCLAYYVCIHILNSFIGFISPLEDPEEYGLNSGDSYLPQKNNEEFKPFQRKVKEYRFWGIVFSTFLVAIPMTFSKAFDIPVFWPVLLFYFILIFYIVMRRQIQHMIKYHYLPWNTGKMKYGK